MDLDRLSPKALSRMKLCSVSDNTTTHVRTVFKGSRFSQLNPWHCMTLPTSTYPTHRLLEALTKTGKWETNGRLFSLFFFLVDFCFFSSQLRPVAALNIHRLWIYKWHALFFCLILAKLAWIRILGTARYSLHVDKQKPKDGQKTSLRSKLPMKEFSSDIQKCIFEWKRMAQNIKKQNKTKP